MANTLLFHYVKKYTEIIVKLLFWVQTQNLSCLSELLRQSVVLWLENKRSVLRSKIKMIQIQEEKGWCTFDMPQSKVWSVYSALCQRETCYFLTKGPTLETIDFTFRIGSTLTFLYFDLYLNTAYAAHYILCFSLTKGLRSKR